MAKREITRKKSRELIIENYQEILRDIRSILDKAKCRAYRAVDNIRVQTYWQIGERIVRAELEHKDRADYGDRLVDRLSEDIGFSRRDIYRIIQFFRYYPIMTAVPSQLSWSHYIELIQISDSSKRKFYESRAICESWSTRYLRRQVKFNLYEHILKEGKLTTITSQALKPVEPEETVWGQVFYTFTSVSTVSSVAKIIFLVASCPWSGILFFTDGFQEGDLWPVTGTKEKELVNYKIKMKKNGHYSNTPSPQSIVSAANEVFYYHFCLEFGICP